MALSSALPVAIVLQLAIAHAPQVAPETIATFAKTESNFNPLAIYDNTADKSLAAATAEEAATLARSLLDRGHSIDTGLMQINSANFARTGLDAESAFDPAKSIAAGAKIMVEAYQWCEERHKGADPLRCMASVYNTGKPTAGERNGYVGRIYAAADHIVSAIRQAAPAVQAPAPEPEAPAIPNACGPPPPAWDGWAVSSHRLCIQRAQIAFTQEKSSDQAQHEDR